MKKNYILYCVLSTLISLFFAYNANGQGFKITGGLLGVEGVDLSNVTITLKSVSNTQPVRGATPNSFGGFMFNGLNSGTYTVHIRATGIHPHKLELRVNNDDIELPLIQLKIDSSQHKLNSVSIIARKPFFRREFAKHMIGSSVYTHVQNVMRFFNGIPFVSTNVFGNIFYHGTEAGIVYVENIKLQLSNQ